MERRRFAFDPFLLDSGTLFRRGVPIAIGYRALLLLEALLARAGAAVPKHDLLNAAWGDTAVEESNLSVQVASLRKILGTGPGGQEWIATVPRLGYRFVATVDRTEAEGVMPSARAGARDRGDEPSIAVLRFQNHCGDPGEGHFADGLSEDIITRLARLRWLFVSARNSSFSYGAQMPDLARIGRELGIRYVLEGSVRRSGQRVRVTATLNDASAGAQVWAERYDSDLADFFTLQDRITESVVASIEPQLYEAERLRLKSKPPENLDAWGLVMQAMPQVWTWGSVRDLDKAEEFLKRATDLDPHYARANSLLAWTHAARAQLGLAEQPKLMLKHALGIAQGAIEADADDPWGHLAAGYVHMVSREFRPAVDELSEAVERNPSLALAHVILGSAYGYGGMADDGLHHLSLAARLSPRDFTQAANLATTGLCHLVAGRYAEAADFERRAVQLRPNFGTAWRTYAASAGLSGDTNLAAQALAQAKTLQPSLSVDWVEKYHPIVQPVHRALYIKGLQAAGLE